MLQATQLLMDRLPCYSDLVATPAAASAHADASESGRQQAAWSSDTILATRVMLLMNALGACLPALPQVTWLAAVCLLSWLGAVCCVPACLFVMCLWGGEYRCKGANEVHLACKQCVHYILPQPGEGVASVRVLAPSHA